MSISERISQIIHTLNIDATEFSKKIGGTPQKVSNWVRGENKPSFETLMDILKGFPEMNARWFLLGEGDMFLNGKATNIHQSHNGIGDNNMALDSCRQLLAEKEKRIESLEQQIKDKETIINLIKSK